MQSPNFTRRSRLTEGYAVSEPAKPVYDSATLDASIDTKVSVWY
jgi:hypothetical protein